MQAKLDLSVCFTIARGYFQSNSAASVACPLPFTPLKFRLFTKAAFLVNADKSHKTCKMHMLPGRYKRSQNSFSLLICMDKLKLLANVSNEWMMDAACHAELPVPLLRYIATDDRRENSEFSVC